MAIEVLLIAAATTETVQKSAQYGSAVTFIYYIKDKKGLAHTFHSYANRN
jgi:hypothetical protein